MQAEEIWFGDSLAARLTRTALLPAAGLYGTGFAVYRALYDLGIKRAYKAPIPVICVGNLAVGGSGKTPATLHIADVLKSLGREVVVSASGYGSPRTEAATIAPPGPLDPREWGDEPAMMRWLRPELKLVVGRRRPLAARLVADAYTDAVMLMDDGFQHLPLAKSVTLLLDPERPKNPFPLPAGPYREFRVARRRADLVLYATAQKMGGSGTELALIDPPGRSVGSNVIPATTRFQLLYDGSQIRTPESEPIKGQDVNTLTAIAQPWRFLDGIREMGYRPEINRTLPDHDPLSAPDLLNGFDPYRTILTTPKDWVKLSLRPDAGEFRWGIVHREAQIYPREPFAGWLRDRIGTH